MLAKLGLFTPAFAHPVQKVPAVYRFSWVPSNPPGQPMIRIMNTTSTIVTCHAHLPLAFDGSPDLWLVMSANASFVYAECQA